CSAVVLELGGGPDSGLVAGTRKGVLAANCGGYFGTFSMGTLGSGSVAGYVLRNVVPNGVLLSASSDLLVAVMTGATLSGTFTWTIPYTGGHDAGETGISKAGRRGPDRRSHPASHDDLPILIGDGAGPVCGLFPPESL